MCRRAACCCLLKCWYCIVFTRILSLSPGISGVGGDRWLLWNVLSEQNSPLLTVELSSAFQQHHQQQQLQLHQQQHQHQQFTSTRSRHQKHYQHQVIRWEEDGRRSRGRPRPCVWLRRPGVVVSTGAGWLPRPDHQEHVLRLEVGCRLLWPRPQVQAGPHRHERRQQGRGHCRAVALVRPVIVTSN